MGEIHTTPPSPAQLAETITGIAYGRTIAACAEYARLETTPEIMSRVMPTELPDAAPAADPTPVESDLVDVPWDGQDIPKPAITDDPLQKSLERRSALLREHQRSIADARRALATIDYLPDADYFSRAAALYKLNPADSMSVARAEAARVMMKVLVGSLEEGAPVMTRDMSETRDLSAPGAIVEGRVLQVGRTPVKPESPGAHIGMEVILDQGNGQNARLIRALPGLLDSTNPGFLWVGDGAVERFDKVARSSGIDPSRLSAARRVLELTRPKLAEG